MMSKRIILACVLAMVAGSLLVAGYVYNQDMKFFLFNQLAWVLVFAYCILVSPDWFKIASYILTMFAIKKLKDDLFNQGHLPHIEDKYIIITGILTFLSIVFIRYRKKVKHGK